MKDDTARRLARLVIRLGHGERFLPRLMRYDFKLWADWLRRTRGWPIGENTSINPKAEMMDGHLVTIGANCSISACAFVTHSGGDRIVTEALGLKVNSQRPIVIGNNVQIGYGARILYGVTIGDWCVIGAGSHITRDVPSGTVTRPPEAAHVGATADYIDRLVRRSARAA